PISDASQRRRSLTPSSSMTRFRLILLAVLFLAPFAALIGLGGWFLIENRLWWPGWAMLACMGLAYFLAWRWTRGRGMLPATAPPPEYWTDRDKAAWAKVAAKANSFQKVTLAEVSTPKHFTDLALELTTEVGAVYNPDSDDPFDNLTLPEVLACIELAAA